MLGVGLHSYGFTYAGFYGLLGFVGFQVLIIALAAVPRDRWRSPIPRGMSDAGSLPGLQCPVPFPNRTEITVGHGGAGRLTEDLLERIFRPAFAHPELEARHDGACLETAGGPARLHDRRPRGEPALFPRRGHRPAGGERDGQRPADVRSAAAVAERRFHPGGGPADRHAGAGRPLDGARPRSPPASPSSPATPRWSSGAKVTASTSRPPGSAPSSVPGPSGRPTSGPATR